MTQPDKTVYVVHAVDTEGPLHVALDAKFETLEELLELDGLERTQETLDAIIAGEIDFGGQQEIARTIMTGHRNNYMDSWPKLDAMLDHAMSPEFRTETTDSFGSGYVYTWFCLDHVGYEDNPRRRELGFHKVFDHYLARIEDQETVRDNAWGKDGLQWHFHPMSTYREAHRCATSLLNSPHITETLTRRIIERRWFPAGVRCGFQTERPDTHWFLEQYIPFDFTNTALEDSDELEDMADMAQGRFGDWRLAPKDWRVYQPSHDNYQVPGDCRRYIARALNIMNRFANLDDVETEKAFRRADGGAPTMLCIATHDFRDLVPEVDTLRALLAAAQAKYPDVKFKFADAITAMRAVVHGDDDGEELALELNVERSDDGLPAAISVRTVRGAVFGPQPFLALETRRRGFIHDNLDFGTDRASWRFVFDHETVVADDVVAVGIGAADRFGKTAVKVIRFDD